MNYICTNCKEYCEIVLYDHGIGRYEYWGASGVDIQIEVESICCGAPVLIEDEKGVIIPLAS